MFDPWVGKIPWRRIWQPIPVLLPGKSRGWRSLIDYRPWGRKESDMTERLHSLTQRKLKVLRDFLLVQWLRFCANNAQGLGLIAGQETRFHMQQLKPGASK